MDHISGSLNKRLNQRSLGTAAQAALVCHKANELAAGRFVARSFRSGMLTLAASSSAAAQELTFTKPAIINEINTRLAAPVVTSLKIVAED